MRGQLKIPSGKKIPLFLDPSTTKLQGWSYIEHWAELYDTQRAWFCYLFSRCVRTQWTSFLTAGCVKLHGKLCWALKLEMKLLAAPGCFTGLLAQCKPLLPICPFKVSPNTPPVFIPLLLASDCATFVTFTQFSCSQSAIWRCLNFTGGGENDCIRIPTSW